MEGSENGTSSVVVRDKMKENDRMTSIKGPQEGKSRTLAWVAFLGAVVLAGAIVFGPGEKPATKTVRPAFPRPEPKGTAPLFTLTALDGNSISLAEFKGKVVIINFWASWCGPCKREVPDFVLLQSQYGASGLQIVGIALDEEKPVRAYASSVGINYPILFGNDDVSRAYGGVEALPTTFIIDRDGTIIHRFVGYQEKSVFENVIRKLLLI
jgi:cytochrome c biogenesis protein CcmG/thiol:disulfide interchange protein DsbE